MYLELVGKDTIKKRQNLNAFTISFFDCKNKKKKGVKEGGFKSLVAFTFSKQKV